MIFAMSRPKPYAVAARELLRNSLLDAALRQATRRPWVRVTMGEIAESAGVSRQTLYKEFGSRQSFLESLLLREVDRFVDPLAPILVAARDDPREAVAQAMGVFLGSAVEHPLVRTIVDSEGAEELRHLFTSRGSVVVRHAVARLAGLLHANWPQVEPAEIELFAECMVRLAVSLAAVPETPSGMTPDAIAMVFAPYVEQVLEAAASASA